MVTCSTDVCGTGDWNGPLPGDPDNSSILTASPEFGGVELSWTMPNLNGFAVSHTRIFRGIAPEFATSIPIAAAAGTQYFDKSAADVIRVYYYWIQHVSINGTVLDPIGPVSATALPMIDEVIAALGGKIEDGMLATELRTRIAKIADLENGLTTINSTVFSENTLLSQELAALRNELTDTVAYIDSQSQITLNDQQALATAVNTQLAQFGTGIYAAIQEESTVRAAETGDLFAQRTIKVDLAGNVSGFGLSARVDPEGNSNSEFQVRADTFSIAPPSYSGTTPPENPFHGKVWVDISVLPNVVKWYNGVTDVWQTTPIKGAVPFIVKTSPEVVDGFTVPPGVYIDSAYISRLQASQIDTRGLSIKDENGNLLFGAGSGLDWALVEGANRPADNATRNVFRGDWATTTAYAPGDIVLDAEGYGWSCVQSHVSGAISTPVWPIAFNDYWTVYTVKGENGTSGLNAVVPILSNEAHVLPADSTGAVTSYTGSGTLVYVYEGSTPLSYDGSGSANGTWTLSSTSSNITRGSITDGGAHAVVGNHSGVTAGVDTASITYTITGRTSQGGAFSVIKTQTFSKSKSGVAGIAGEAGPAGPAVVVTTDRPPTFSSTDGTLDAAQANIVLTAAVSGVASPTYVWSFSGLQTNPTASTTNTQTITAAQFGTAKSANITCTVNGVHKDQVAVVRLEKSTAEAGATVGANAGNLNVAIGGGNLLYNSGFEFDANSDGVPDGWTGTSVGTGLTMTRSLVPSTAGAGNAFRLAITAITPPTSTSSHSAVQTTANQVRVIPGGTYVLSYLAKTSTLSYRAYHALFYYQADGVTAATPSNGGGVTTSFTQIGIWTRVTQTVTVPVDCAFVRVRFGINRTAGVNDTTLGDIEFDSMQFELGDVYTSYKPSSLDLVGVANPITPENVSTYIQAASIGAAQIGSISLVGTNNFNVKTATTGARMEMDSRAIKVFDANGVLRVQLGDLTV